VQDDALHGERAAGGYPSQSPMEYIDSVHGTLGSRQTFAPADEVSSYGSTGLASVARAEARLSALQPYLRALGPDGFQVLPKETLASNTPGSALLAAILQRIARRAPAY